MNHGLRYWCETALLIAGALFLLGALYWLFILGPKARTVLNNVNSATIQLNASLDQINRPCSKKHPCGTIAEANKTLIGIQYSMATIQSVARNTNKVVSKVGDTVTSVGNNINTTLVSMQGVTDSAKTAISTNSNSLNIILQGLPPFERSSTQAANNLNALVSDPEIKNTVRNLNSISANVKVTSGNLASTSTDIKVWTHNELYPPKCKTKLGCFGRGLIGGVKVGSKIAPGAYWGAKFIQILTGNN